MDITSEHVRDDVLAAIASDPRVLHPHEIAVDADGGMVTLRGTVGSFVQERAAVATAQRTPGVYRVYDQLRVRLLDEDRRHDAEIRGDALQRIISDSGIRSDDLDVAVREGWVTLRGNVAHQSESDLAFDHAATLHGVVGVTNEIEVVEEL